MRCIEALRKNVCSIRVAIMKKPIPSVSCGQVQLVRAGGWATYSYYGNKNRRFMYVLFHSLNQYNR